MQCSGHSNQSNARYVVAAVTGTVLVYAMRLIAANEDDQHLKWRCPVPMSAAIFAVGQLSGLVGGLFTDNPYSRRQGSEPPAAGPLRLYMCVSVTSSVMLTFVLLWVAGLFPVPRCLSGSASCMRLRDNLEQTGWINVALCVLTTCQIAGAVGAGRSLCCQIDERGVPDQVIHPVVTLGARQPPIDIVYAQPIDRRSHEATVVEGVVV
jgi:hypothetical protein